MNCRGLSAAVECPSERRAGRERLDHAEVADGSGGSVPNSLRSLNPVAYAYPSIRVLSIRVASWVW